MPSYILAHGTSTTSVGCGNLVVSNAGGSTTVTSNPPGNAPSVNITSDVTFTPKAGGGGTLMNPVAGDMLNLGSYQVTVNGTSYSFSNNATYRAAGGGQMGGFYTQPGITGGQGDWDAADGSGKP
jgi:hypothetical protein